MELAQTLLLIVAAAVVFACLLFPTVEPDDDEDWEIW